MLCVCVCVCGRLEMKGGILPPPPHLSKKKKKLFLADQLERQLRCFLDTWSLFFFFRCLETTFLHGGSLHLARYIK